MFNMQHKLQESQISLYFSLQRDKNHEIRKSPITFIQDNNSEAAKCWSIFSRTRLIFILSSDTGHKLRKETVLKQQENIILM